MPVLNLQQTWFDFQSHHLPVHDLGSVSYLQCLPEYSLKYKDSGNSIGRELRELGVYKTFGRYGGEKVRVCPSVKICCHICGPKSAIFFLLQHSGLIQVSKPLLIITVALCAGPGPRMGRKSTGSQACHHCLRKRLASGPFFLLNLISHCSRRELRGSVECGYWTLVPETQVKPGRRWETIVTTIYICIPPAPDFSHLFHEDINNTGFLESYLD